MLSLHAWLETLDTIDDLNAYPIEYIIEYVKIHPRSIIKINNELLEAFMVHHMNAAIGHANASTQTMNSYDAIMEYFNEHIQRAPKAHEFREYMTARILVNHYARILRQIQARGTRNARIVQIHMKYELIAFNDKRILIDAGYAL